MEILSNLKVFYKAYIDNLYASSKEVKTQHIQMINKTNNGINTKYAHNHTPDNVAWNWRC